MKGRPFPARCCSLPCCTGLRQQVGAARTGAAGSDYMMTNQSYAKTTSSL